jgi:hypothetical protein
MAYGHAERNLALIRQLEAETEGLLGTLEELDPEQSAWLHDRHRPRPDRAQPSTAAPLPADPQRANGRAGPET